MLSNEILQSVKDIAVAAGAILLDYYQDKSIAVNYKKDDSPVTAADTHANAYITNALRQISDALIIAEESVPQLSAAELAAQPRKWLVDPMDGTKEFIQRNGEFTVNIGYVEGAIPLLGVVYAPCTHMLYWATKGQGAFSQAPDGTVVPLRVASFTLTQPHLTVVCSRSHLNEATAHYLATLQAPHILRLGSTLKAMHVAAGKAHLAPCLYPTMEWDTAAADIIVSEAGGQVLQPDGHTPLPYGKTGWRNHGHLILGKIIAAE